MRDFASLAGSASLITVAVMFLVPENAFALAVLMAMSLFTSFCFWCQSQFDDSWGIFSPRVCSYVWIGTASIFLLRIFIDFYMRPQ